MTTRTGGLDRTNVPGESVFVETNGVRLHTVQAGPEDGALVVLLHGFPEFWYCWHDQVRPLVNEGYRVVVPDQRGYNRSDKPDGIDAYAIDELAADAVGLLDALDHERARFVGHDWGAAVTWQTLLAHPDRVERGVIVNVPHPAVFNEFVPGRPRQVLKSWYMFLFQLPRIPEFAFSAADWRGLRWFMDTSNREDTFTRQDVRRYKEAWSQPGAFTGMLNWYRAAFQTDAAPPTMTVEPETMVVWGTQDPYLHRDMAPASIDYCTDGRLELVEDATHWVQHERPDRVNELLVEFLD